MKKFGKDKFYNWRKQCIGIQLWTSKKILVFAAVWINKNSICKWQILWFYSNEHEIYILYMIFKYHQKVISFQSFFYFWHFFNAHFLQKRKNNFFLFTSTSIHKHTKKIHLMYLIFDVFMFYLQKYKKISNCCCSHIFLHNLMI